MSRKPQSRDLSEMSIWKRWPKRLSLGVTILKKRTTQTVQCFVYGHEWNFAYCRANKKTGADSAICDRCGTHRMRHVPSSGAWPAGAEEADDELVSDTTAGDILEDT